jgi:ribose transport system permease protein
MKNTLLKDFLPRFGVPAFLLFCLLIVQLLNRGLGLLSASNLMLVFQQSVTLILLSFGLSLVMIGGETDMSIAGVMGFIGAVFVTCINQNLGLGISIAISITASLVVAAFNGFIVGKFGYSSFLVTIATMFITSGMQYRFSNGLTVWFADKSIKNLSEIHILGIPLFIFVILIAGVIYYILIYHTKWGFNVRIVGENSKAADEVGINTKLVKVMIFVVASIFYGIAGVIEPLRVSGSVLYAGNTFLLPAMAACYLGSTMFVPGKVNVLGTLFSAFFLSFILNILTFLSVKYFYVNLVQGGLLIVSVVIANIKNRSIKQQIMA